MSPSHTIDVILAHFNRADTLVEAIQSVLNQTHRNLKLYLVNDGSTDSSMRYVSRLNDERIVSIDLPNNVGVARARNVGIEHATAGLIAFMDSDDVWLPQKLELQLVNLREAQEQNENVGMIGCGWKFYGGSPTNRSFTVGPFTREDVLHERVAGIGTPMLLVDRSVAERVARFDERLPALVDRDYVMSCLANGSQIVVLPEPLALVRRGRSDHVATSRRAAAAYEVMLEKYSTELAKSTDLRSWYSFRTSREYLLHGNIRSAARHLAVGISRHRFRRAFHLLMAALGRRNGLAVAQRLLPVRRPD